MSEHYTHYVLRVTEYIHVHIYMYNFHVITVRANTPKIRNIPSMGPWYPCLPLQVVTTVLRGKQAVAGGLKRARYFRHAQAKMCRPRAIIARMRSDYAQF